MLLVKGDISSDGDRDCRIVPAKGDGVSGGVEDPGTGVVEGFTAECHPLSAVGTTVNGEGLN
jgi:hypothetical protein